MKVGSGSRERLQRVRGFWKLYTTSKFGLFGLGLLLSFVVLATIAPFLSPYDPYASVGISSAQAVPSWFTLFNSNISSDARLVSDPQLSNPQDFGQFKFSASLSGTSLNVSSVASTATGDSWSVTNGTAQVGRIYANYSRVGSGGAVNIDFKKTMSFLGTVQVVMLREVTYQSAPPPRFRLDFNSTLSKSPAVGYRFSVSILNTNNTEYRLWDSVSKYNTVIVGGQGFKTGNLTTTEYVLDSYLVSPETRQIWFGTSTAVAAQGIFAHKGAYVIKMEFDFKPGASGPENAQFTVSDLQLKIDGEASGLLGTDNLGRDIFTQLVYGSRWALYVGVLSAILGVAIGLGVGLMAGYFGGLSDEVLMRFADFVLVLPFLPFLIVLSVLLRPSITNITWIIAVLGWPGIARLIRSIVLSLKSRAFVEAAKASGAGSGRILYRHMLPNVSPIAFTQLVLFIPTAIVTVTAITFLGLGDATVVDWGYMTNAAFSHNFRAWWWILPPGILTALLSSSFLFIGYAMDSLLNPRLRRR